MRVMNWDLVVETTTGEKVQLISGNRVRVRMTGGRLEIDGVDCGRVSSRTAETIRERSTPVT